ncbi:MAG: efflux RND transporter periplasmic adaptor subunit [Deltaproteobacteria bacterium]|nr:efflux RND transporter periplasmic adaptor subunit [Deltaproteobacteria bacterium]
MANGTESQINTQNVSNVNRRLRVAAMVAMPILVIAVAAAVAFYLMETAPRAERAEKPRPARVVETISLERADHPTVIPAWGQVRPAREVTLKAQVQGKVIEINPKLAPGGRFGKGEIVLKIDPSDYRLAVRQRESDVAKARAELQVEEGNQVIARKESELLGDELSQREQYLVLRQPQLSTVKASLAAAEAALAEARLALERTTVRAPFDSIVISRQADVGTLLTTSADIANLAGTDTYWVELAIPTLDLRWIAGPAGSEILASPVRLYNDSVWGANIFRSGRVVRLLGDLTSEGRMARLLVEVGDPLATTSKNNGKPALLIGAYLRAEIKGRVIKNAIALDRAALRDGNKVWTINDAGTLEVRDVVIAFRSSEKVFITGGVMPGERAVVSNITGAIPGIPLRTIDGIDNSNSAAERDSAASRSQSVGANR